MLNEWSYVCSSPDVQGVRSLEATFDLVVDFGSTLAQVCPLIGLIGKSILVGTFRAPVSIC